MVGLLACVALGIITWTIQKSKPWNQTAGSIQDPKENLGRTPKK